MRCTTADVNSTKRANFAAKFQNKFDRWLDLIKQVPKPLKTLTEDEWIAACRYFGKCATCGNESIDARAFFITFALGGRYAAWNVIPVCDKCATALRRQQNPFIKYSDNVDNIVSYLQPILERMINNDN